MDKKEKILFGVLELYEAERIMSSLEGEKLNLEIRHNKETCHAGCRVTVEMWCNEEDLPKLAEFLQKEQLKLFEGLNVRPELMHQVFDENATEAVCPACGASFSTSKLECPECGLGFG